MICKKDGRGEGGVEDGSNRIPLKESSWPGKQQRIGIIPLVFRNGNVSKTKTPSEDLNHEYALTTAYQWER